MIVDLSQRGGLLDDGQIEARGGHAEGDAVEEAHAVVMGAAVLPPQYAPLVKEQEEVVGYLRRDLIGSSAIVANQIGYEAEVGQLGHLC